MRSLNGAESASFPGALWRSIRARWLPRANHWRALASLLPAIAIICLLRGGVPKDDGSVMKCSNPNCRHGIGLVSYQRGWFDKQRFCSKKCRDDLGVERPIKAEGPRPRLGRYLKRLFENAASRANSLLASRRLCRRPS